MDSECDREFSAPFHVIRWFGWWKVKTTSFRKKFLYGFYRSFSVSWLTVFTLLEIRDLYDASAALEALSTNICGSSVAVVSVLKTLRVLHSSENVEDLHSSLKENLYVSHVGKEDADKLILKRTSQEMTKLWKIFLSLAVPTVLGWALFPFIDDSEEYALPLRLWMPFDWHSSPGYEFAYANQFLGLWVFGANIITQDLIFFGFVMRLCSQYEILEKNIRKLNEFCTGGSSIDERALVREIKKSIAHHQEILRRIKQLQFIYSDMLLFHFWGCLPLLCVIGFNILHAFKMSGVNTRMVTQIGYVMSTLFDVLLYCIFGERLKQRGYKIAEAVYDGIWYKVGDSPRKLFLMLMATAQRSPGLSAGRFITINLRYFLHVLRSAYNIFAVMNQMSE